jgi:protein O-GlcNAc transferase
VITLAGDRHASRVGASLLTAVGRAGWIARNVDEYVARAVALASDTVRCGDERIVLRGAMRESALLDHAGQAERFGNALRGMWRTWCDPREACVANPA